MALERAVPADPGDPQNPMGKIGILMGGPSTEREISLRSGKAVYESLQQAGWDVVSIDIRTDDVQETVRLLEASRLGCAFIALHGRFGEDGQIQEILERLKIPYTGSGPSASRVALDKIASRKLFEVYGLTVPKYKVLEKAAYKKGDAERLALDLPLVVKPATHGSSIGLSLVERAEGLEGAVEAAFAFDERLLIEEYVSGREVTVGILDKEALPVIEIVPKAKFFDYAAKYQSGVTEYIVPAHLEYDLAREIQLTALSAHSLLGCFGFSRVDMIVNKDSVPCVLEVNTIPGLTETSLLPKAARVAGIEFTQMCIKFIELAYLRALAGKGTEEGFALPSSEAAK